VGADGHDRGRGARHQPEERRRDVEEATTRLKRFLGVTPGYGKAVGVDEKWMYSIVKQIGNYGDSFRAQCRQGHAAQVERGQNALWTNGGLMYAIPFR